MTHAAVLEQFAANLPVLRELLVATVDALPAGQDDCECGQVYAGSPPTFDAAVKVRPNDCGCFLP